MENANRNLGSIADGTVATTTLAELSLLSRRLRRRFFAAALLVAYVLGAGAIGGHRVSLGGTAEAAPVAAEEVKAAFLFNFAKFVTWPSQALRNRTIAICILGGDSFEKTLEEVVGGRSVAERAVVVRRHDSVEEAGACQIVFVPASESARTSAILERLAKKPILTVGESDGFAARGGIINFRVEESRVRFEVNPDAAERAGLELSSQLLKLAIVVRE